MKLNKIYCGDSLEILKTFPDKAINCIVTSPPYWGLRDYGNENQLGLEKTPELYINKLTEIFRECKRVLKDDGTLWLNLGDSYYNNFGAGKNVNTGNAAAIQARGRHNVLKHDYLKIKDLCGIPWKVAFALQCPDYRCIDCDKTGKEKDFIWDKIAKQYYCEFCGYGNIKKLDGWYLRSDIIWSKGNPMPESVTDRPTKSHEYIFLLSKNQKYYYDNESIKEPFAKSSISRMKYPVYGENTKGKENKYSINANSKYNPDSNGINKRSVWVINTKSFSKAHFAVYPEKLIEPCIKAGCPEGGIVLDPFSGSGTTGLVAKKLNRNYIGIELNNDYIKIAEKRIKDYTDQLRLI